MLLYIYCIFILYTDLFYICTKSIFHYVELELKFVSSSKTSRESLMQDTHSWCKAKIQREQTVSELQLICLGLVCTRRNSLIRLLIISSIAKLAFSLYLRAPSEQADEEISWRAGGWARWHTVEREVKEQIEKHGDGERKALSVFSPDRLKQIK